MDPENEQGTETAKTDSKPKSSSASTSSSSSGAPKQTPVVVKKWNAVAFWKYDIANDTCAICHNALMVPCIQCESEVQRVDECSPAWGVCGHSYHFHCISRWLKTRSTCPIDDAEWEFVSY